MKKRRKNKTIKNSKLVFNFLKIRLPVLSMSVLLRTCACTYSYSALYFPLFRIILCEHAKLARFNFCNGYSSWSLPPSFILIINRLSTLDFFRRGVRKHNAGRKKPKPIARICFARSNPSCSRRSGGEGRSRLACHNAHVENYFPWCIICSSHENQLQ